MMRRLPAIFLVLWFAALGSGLLMHLHELQHQREDALAAAQAKAHGLPSDDHPEHDDDNCPVHAQLHLPLLPAAWTALLVLLGLTLPLRPLLPPLPVALTLPARIDCRGPPS